MRKFGLMLVSVTGLMVMGTGVIADPAQPAPGTAQTAQASDAELDKTVCKTLPPPTGSRLGTRRECRTQREWDMIQQRARQETEHQQVDRMGTGSGG